MATTPESKLVNITEFNLEKHVENAFRQAWSLAKDEPILLKDWKEPPTSSASEKQAETTAEASLQPKNPPIERIILYIDDLDRCPPQRVVEVLQAVHLLLAFDLFNVVVAVDVRWLERSLNETYNPNNHGNSSLTHRFNAHNYLEKIFQIPFQLPKMTPEGYSALIESLANIEEVKTETFVTTKETGIEQDADKTPTVGSELNGVAATPNPTGAKTPAQPRAGSENGPPEPSKPNLAQPEKSSLKKTKPRDAMRLLDHEKLFIEKLFPFIPSPRQTKRFINRLYRKPSTDAEAALPLARFPIKSNTYRLLRVGAAMNHGFAELVDVQIGQYRPVLVLLAITIGCVEVAPEIMCDLRNTRNSTDGFLGWLAKLPERYTQKTGGDCENIIIEKINRIVSHLEALKNTLEQNSMLPQFDDRLATYCKWADVVSRYSFRGEL